MSILPDVETESVEVYRQRLHFLYAHVERWLSETVPGVTFQRVETLFEDPETQSYEAPKLEILDSEQHQLTIVPQGVRSFGFGNRVLFFGPRGRESLVFFPELAPDHLPEPKFGQYTASEDVPGWHWVPRSIDFPITPLTAEVFYKLYVTISGYA